MAGFCTFNLSIGSFFQGLSQLVGAGGGTGAAMDALDAGNGLIDVHTGDESGDALGVARATAREGNLHDGVSIHVDVDHAGANPRGLVGKVVHD